MKKVLGASIGVLAITFMSFANPLQANIKANDAQVIYAQPGSMPGVTKSKTTTTPKPPTTIVISTVISTTVSTIIKSGLTSEKNLAQLNDAMNRY